MKLIYKKGVHRPLTMGIQKVVGTDSDGFFGPKTEEAVKRFQKNNNLKESGIVADETLSAMLPLIEEKYKILEVICCFEVGGPDYCKSAWGKKTKIDDGAGWNYGPMQHNKFGSLQLMKKKFGFENPDVWYGTPAGALGQMWFFEEEILKDAKDFAEKIWSPTPRTRLLLSDAHVQGGGVYPTKPPRLWDDWPFSKDLIPKIQEIYRKYQIKQAFVSCLSLVDSGGEMYAELHPRSGVKKFLKDQLSRRRTAYHGTGVVHGEKYDLSEFGL